MSDGLTIAEQLKIQAILLSHTHYDHTRDIPNIAMTYSSDITLFHHLGKDIRSEVAEVVRELNAPIELAYEGMEISL